MIDSRERRIAVQIERSCPRWLVMWGCYSRLYWAFPRFPTPHGIIVNARDPDSLLTETHNIELSTFSRRRTYTWPNQLPHWLTNRQEQAAAYARPSLGMGPPAPASRGEWASPRPLSQGTSERSPLAASATAANTDTGPGPTADNPHRAGSDLPGRLYRLWRARASR